MPAEAVIDASVLGAVFFNEEGSRVARGYVNEGRKLTAPAFLVVEIASLASKKVWRSEASLVVAERAVRAVQDFVEDLVPDVSLASSALTLAAEHHISAYDALYVALAMRLEAPLLTFDSKLRRRVHERRIPIIVDALNPASP